MTDKFQRTHTSFKANLLSLYMTLTAYPFRFSRKRKFDLFVSNASENSEQLSFWQTKRIRFFQFQLSFL